MIHFNKIRWKNLLSTGNVWTEINLSDTKATLIIGNNGAGKSTILDALTFGLFGKPFWSVNKNQLINSVNQGGTEVEIEFDIMDYNPKNEVHDTSVLESYATGKKVKPRGTGKVSDPYEGYSPDLKADDYAKGGRVSLSKGGLSKILGV